MSPVSAISGGNHTRQISASSGTATSVVTVSGSFTSSNTFTYAGGSVRGTIQASQDPRAVGLIRAGAHDETVDANGTIYGDTLYSIHETIWSVSPSGAPTITNYDAVNWQMFTASRSPGWSNALSWTWNPNSSANTIDAGNWSQLFGQVSETVLLDGNQSFSGIDAPQTRTLTYTLTDDLDGFSTTANYVLTMHDPREQRLKNFNLEPHNWRQIGGNVTNRTNADVTYQGGYYEVGSGYSLGVTWNPEKLADELGLGLLGLSLDYSIQISGNAGQQVNPITLPPNTYSYLELADDYMHYWGDSQAYDAGGPTGIVNFDYSVPKGFEMQMAPPQPISGSTGGGGNSGGGGGGN